MNTKIMKKATLEDLCREKWLRDRNNGEIVWETKDGKQIPLKDLTDSHLDNIIQFLIKKEEFDDIAAEYAAFIDSSDLG